MLHILWQKPKVIMSQHYVLWHVTQLCFKIMTIKNVQYKDRCHLAGTSFYIFLSLFLLFLVWQLKLYSNLILFIHFALVSASHQVRHHIQTMLYP